MIMAVGMGKHMGVGCAVVGMHDHMGVPVGMVFGQGVVHHKYRTAQHQRQGEEVGRGGPLPIDDKGQQNADEGRGGIVGTCLRGAQCSLRPDIEKNAQAICHISKHHDRGRISRGGNGFSQNYRNEEGTAAGEKALQHHDLIGAFVGNPPCAVVFKPPAAGGQQHKQGAQGKPEASGPFKGKEKAGQGHEANGNPEPAGHLFFEQQQRNQGCGDDLKIAQQGSIGSGAQVDPDHQENRRPNIQKNHTDDVGQIRFGKPFRRFFLPPAEQIQNPNANSRAQIQECRHEGGRHMLHKNLGKGCVQRVKHRRKQRKGDCGYSAVLFHSHTPIEQSFFPVPLHSSRNQ